MPQKRINKIRKEKKIFIWLRLSSIIPLTFWSLILFKVSIFDPDTTIGIVITILTSFITLILFILTLMKRNKIKQLIKDVQNDKDR